MGNRRMGLNRMCGEGGREGSGIWFIRWSLDEGFGFLDGGGVAKGCGEDVWGGGEGRIGMGCWRWEIWGIRSIGDREY